VKYAWIAGQGKAFSLVEMCDVLDVSISGYRAWKRGGKSDRKRLTDSQMLALIRAIHAELKGAYGSPRMVRELRARGFSASKERVERLMRDNGIHARHKRRYKVTTDSKHGCRWRKTCWPETSRRRRRIRSGRRTSPTCGPMKAGCTWPSCSTCSTAKSLAGR
jgi:transposase InsO family protein